jgi:hypothetical protein
VKGLLAKQKPFKVENPSHFEKYLLQTKWTNTCISWHDAMYEKPECLATCLHMTNELRVKEYCLPLNFFMCEEYHHCAK